MESNLCLRTAGRFVAGAVLIPFLGCGVDEDTRDPFREIVDISRDEAALAEYLQPVPPKEPQEALESFEAVDGFRMEMVAHEPLVNDPVAAAFDENGRLYVAEMRDYPYQPGPGEKPIGVVRLLEDTDGDGTLDQSHIFADELLWTTGVTVWKGGVFVTAPPDIWYLKDTDGDAKADIRKKVYSGFGHQNEQQMMNSIIMGVDHWIYGIASGNAGEIRSLENPDSPPVSLGARDFRFDPVSGRFETTTQTFQFGHAFDEWFNRFVCNQGMPGRHVVLPARYLERNPYLFVNLHRWLGPGANQVKPLVQGQTRLYKISPVEGWRTIRQARRIFAGSSSRSAGVGHDYLTAGSGVTMYTGHAYPEKYRGSYFMGANTGNLIHRRVLIDDGVTFRSERGEAEGSEFVRTADNWFRPVNAVNAPDGTVYFLDMSRELIEATHVPGRVMKHLDFTNGRDRGRIYRLAPPGFVSPPPPRLGEATIEELVAHLEHEGGWWRATAHRLIREREDRSAAPLLRRLLRESSRPLARMHALWSLEGIGSLRDRDLLRGLGDPEAGVRVHAVRLAESRLNRSRALFRKVSDLAQDPEIRVRFQVALSLGEVRGQRALPALVRIAREDTGDFWVRNAVLSSCAEFGHQLFARLANEETFLAQPESVQWLSRLARAVGARERARELRRVLGVMAANPVLAARPSARQEIILGMAEGLAYSGGSLLGLRRLPASAASMIKSHMERAGKIAADDSASLENRLESIRLLHHDRLARVKPVLASLVDPQQPQDLQIAAIDALAGFESSEIPGLLLADWTAHSPRTRSKILETLFARQEWTSALLEAVSEELIAANQIDAKRRDLLVNHDDESIRERAARLLGSEELGSRKDVLAAFQASLSLTGDHKRGEAVYRRECLKCHRLSSREHPIGPNLIRGSDKDPESLLVNILDPNRFVEPQYLQYVATDLKGGLYTGLLRDETATSVTLVEGDDLRNTLLRENIKEIRATTNSLMPEGLEENINHQEMADVISFILKYQYEVGTESAGIGYGEEVYEEMMLHPSLRPENQDPQKGN